MSHLAGGESTPAEPATRAVQGRTEEARHGSTAASAVPAFSRLMALQRSAGNQALAALMVQRQRRPSSRAPLAGRAVSTQFGRFFVVPDGAPLLSRSPALQPISESELQAATTSWEAVINNTGSLRIYESDMLESHPGFRNRVLAALRNLMRRPRGRGLVMSLVNGRHDVQIVARNAERASGHGGLTEAVDGRGATTPGVGSAVRIALDPGWSEVQVIDTRGRRLAVPDLIRVGHELIHAARMTHGATSRDREQDERETIETGDLTENQLRDEHRVGARPGQAVPHRRGHGSFEDFGPMPSLRHNRTL